VHRERLFRRLDEARRAPLTLVAAPAGFGKTTLVARWLRSREIPFAWFSADAGDNDPLRFWSYVVTALERADGVEPEDAAALVRGAEPDPERVVTVLLNDLARAGPGDGEPAVLVVDDLHAVEEREVHRTLRLFLERLPPGLRVVVTARADPPLPLARYRARGHLAEIRQDELRFSRDEVDRYVRDLLEVELEGEALEALAQRTEGWAASLQLAGLSLRRLDPSEHRGFVRTFAGDDRYVVDYLVDEVLERQPPVVQRFLLATSVVDRMCTDLCRVLVEAAAGADPADAPELADLERDGLFVVPLDRTRRWFRYHQLFGELLRVRARRSLDVPGLLGAASRWFEEEGLVEEAVEYAFRSGDPDRAQHVLEQHFPVLIGTGQLRTLRRFVARLPEARVEASTALSTAMAYVEYLSTRLAEAEQWIERVDALLEQARVDADRWRIQQAHLDLLRGFRAEALQDADEARARYLAARDAWRSVGRGYLEAVSEQGLADTWLAAEELPRAESSARRAWTLGWETGNYLAAASGLARLGHILLARGRPADAREALQAGADEVRTRLGDEAGLVLGYLQGSQAHVLVRENRLAEATELLDRAETLGRDANYPSVEGGALMARLALTLSRGELDAADMAAARLEELFGQRRILILVERLFEILTVRLRIARGELGAAAEWAATVPEDGPFPTLTGIARARIRLALGEPREAAVELEGLARSARARGAFGWALDADLLRARALDALRDRRADEVLAHALRQGAESGAVRPFLDGGPELAEAVARIGARGGERDLPAAWTARLLGLFTEEARPAEEPDELLTDRELEVLRLLDAGLSNRETAERLFVAEGTVKKHTHNIYRKLGVSRRNEALARARDREIL
jgi:LuxR family maltose regulon positive regulatory protein